MKILVCLPLTGPQREDLSRSLSEDELHFIMDDTPDPDARAAFNGSEVVFGNPPPEWFLDERLPRWVQFESVGFGEYVDVGLAAGPDFPRVTNLAGFFSEPVAESILAGLLAVFRGLDSLQALQRKAVWIGDGLRPKLRLLKGASVVMLGRGAINNRLAELLAPFDCHLTSFGRDMVLADLDEALRAADVIACCVPHTERTMNLFGADRLSLLKPSAVFLNFGRGSLIDEAALADALAANRLAGAVIDVTREEPLPPGHRFWTTPGLILTQHTAGGSEDEIGRKIRFFLENLARYRASRPLLSPVDFKRGY